LFLFLCSYKRGKTQSGFIERGEKQGYNENPRLLIKSVISYKKRGKTGKTLRVRVSIVYAIGLDVGGVVGFCEMQRIAFVCADERECTVWSGLRESEDEVQDRYNVCAEGERKDCNMFVFC